MIRIEVDTGPFTQWARRAENDLRSGARQALGQSVALALRHARTTTAFKDQTHALRKSIVRGQESPWVHFVRASAKHAVFVESGTKAHPIVARKAKMLRFLQAGQIRFARRVQHPGTKPTHFMAHASEAGESALVNTIERLVDRTFG